VFTTATSSDRSKQSEDRSEVAVRAFHGAYLWENLRGKRPKAATR
jgi:hypothetical protein